MIVVPVYLGARSYEVRIGSGLLAQAGAMVAPLTGNRRVAVVTDTNVAALHLGEMRAGFAAAGLETFEIVLPPGEATKNWRYLEALVEQLLTLGVERGDAVVALGGGVIGDLTGFACAVLRRGCKFVQVPTTLLAQVDSSVGGKTAINAAAGKNLVGAFHQPSLVVIDPQVLQTLPDRELRAGYAEVVKYGLIGDAPFFDWCEANVGALLARDPAALTHAIAASVTAKAATVAADEHETTGIRALLNLGHTFGHALEAEAGFSAKLLHGEAVATGMALAFAFSAEQGLCPAADAARVRTHLAAAGLPVDPLPADPAALILHMRQDKKMAAGALSFILARGIGDAFVAKGVDLSAVEAFLCRTIASRYATL